MTSSPVGTDQSAARRGSTVIRTLLLTDFVDSTRLVESLGDQQAARIFARHDRRARDLLERHGGREIDKTDGFLFLFTRPVDAIRYALAYHDALLDLSADCGVPLKARAGVHLGEVVLLENAPADIQRGAKPIEVEGLAKPTAARVMSLARGGQTLLTRAAFEMGKRASVGVSELAEGVTWVQHGVYRLKGVDEPVPIFEVGRDGQAPLAAPRDSEKVQRLHTRRRSSWLQAALLAALVLAAVAVFALERARDRAAARAPEEAVVSPAGEAAQTPAEQQTPAEEEEASAETPAGEAEAPRSAPASGEASRPAVSPPGPPAEDASAGTSAGTPAGTPAGPERRPKIPIIE